MKKIILSFCLLLSFFAWDNVFAARDLATIDQELQKVQEDKKLANGSELDRLEEREAALESEKQAASNSNSGSTAIKVKITEKIPGGNCGEKNKDGLYECEIKPGFKSIQEIMWNIIKWLTALAALAWVLFIVVNGIMLSTGSDSGEVKKRIVKGIIWLILVLLSGLILNMIAPWVYR